MENPPKAKKTKVAMWAGLVVFALIAWKACTGHAGRHLSGRMPLCQENLVKIDGAKEQYALEHNLKVGDSVTVEQIIGLSGGTAYLKTFPVEPNGGTYIIGKIGEPPRCSTGLPGHSLSAVGIAITVTE